MITGIVAGAPVAAGPPPGASYYDEVMADNPLGYWRFTEVSGTSAVNSGSAGSGSGGYNGSLTLGLPSLVGDPSDKSIILSGGFVSMGANPVFALADDFTYEAVIIVPTAGSDRTIFSFNNGGFCMRLDTSNRLQAVKSFVAARGNTASAVGTAGDTVHVVITVDSSGALTFYVNGVSAGSGITASDYGSPANSFLIGADFMTSNPWTGGIDECAVYDTALSGARIAAHFAASGI